ncbi:MAG: exodeoxyribonuclease VII large subunit [Caldilineaceae bacterium]|nr:exodeoxyribonuclease VII large subunit [Caldilineaceae bacterium]MCB9120305.1 exodeoxyribonuclease VII large subunit [Caldilineaceae bacterium]MCB9124134.1 exodeoxyribonuclease VII large subunit [Caldilineaceae bacterium]
MPPAALTVTAVTLHIRQLLEQDDALRDLQVLGEVSNWKRAASGHIYFRLKDSGATITAVMWRNAAQAQSWLPREGDQVVAHGYVGVYPENGAYQLYVNRLQPAGKGQLYARFEALKEKLAAEGLFDEERKRPVTSLPRRIGVVTSADAAALRDILRVLSARWPLVDVVVFSTLVQGAEAPARIVAAIETANRYSRDVEPIDTLLVARGGGSIEDLWAFNDEGVARAIAASAIPTIAGVGHEVDFTIADFVADVRAPTPSAAAAGAVPDRAEAIGQLRATMQALQQRAARRIGQEERALANVRRRLDLVHPRRRLDEQRQRLDERERRLHFAVLRALARRAERRLAAAQRLESLNPSRVLQRGYSIVRRRSGEIVVDPAAVSAGEPLDVRAARGSYGVVVAGEG